MKKKGKIMKLCIILGSILLICTLLTGIFPLGIQTVSATYLAESYHPYANNYENTWTISELGVAEMRLHFTKIELGRRDYVRILDKDKNALTSYGDYYHDESLEDVWTEWFTGDTLKIKLETDGSGTAFGFIVDKVETRTESAPTSSYLAETYHFYANNYDHTWTISELGVAEMRLHFTKIELGRRDYVRILDKDKNALTSYGDYYHDKSLEDVWTEWFTGDTLKVKLETDGSGTAFGFIVDKKETRGTVPTPEPTTCLVESYHPYANNYENTWTISELGVAEMRLHFTKIELGRRDYVRILDKDKNALTSYGDYYHDKSLEDVWTEWFTGDTLKVKLETDGSGTAFGFIVDKKETRGTAPTAEPTPSPSPTPTITSAVTPTPKTPASTSTPTITSTPTPTLKPGELYVHLYGHKTDVTVGEVVILYLSVINPITSPGTLKVQLTLQVPSGWSITSGEFSPPVGGFQTAVYDIEQGHNPKTIGINMLANQPFNGVISGYTDYYFIEEPESKYHKEVNEPVTAKEKKLLPSPTSRPAETPTPKPPGFEAILAIAGLLAVVYLLRRKG